MWEISEVGIFIEAYSGIWIFTPTQVCDFDAISSVVYAIDNSYIVERTASVRELNSIVFFEDVVSYGRIWFLRGLLGQLLVVGRDKLNYLAGTFFVYTQDLIGQVDELVGKSDF